MNSNHWNGGMRLRALLVLALALLTPFNLAATTALAAPSCTTSGTTVTCTFSYTGAPETWTEPEGGEQP